MPSRRPSATKRRPALLRTLRIVLIALLVAFAIGFVIGSLIRRELERPVHYYGQHLEERGARGIRLPTETDRTPSPGGFAT